MTNGRLAGRISFDKERTSIDKMPSGKSNGSPNGPSSQPATGRSDRNGKKSGDFRIEIKSFNDSKANDRRGDRQKPSRADQPIKEANNNEQKAKPRQRRESDNHVVKNVLYQLVNKVVRETRREERLNDNEEKSNEMNEMEKKERKGNEEMNGKGEDREDLLETRAAETINSSKESSPSDSPNGFADGLADGSPVFPRVPSPIQETTLSLVTESLVRPQIIT
jgi:hypothetical protein